MGPTFSTILSEFWTDFLQFSAKDGGGLEIGNEKNNIPLSRRR